MTHASSATTVFLSGITAAVADITLNDLSRSSNFARLRDYFQNKSILQAAGYAALTVAIGSAAVVLATRFVFGFDVPASAKETALLLATSFTFGYGMDVYIQRMHVFVGLEAYYTRYGAGVWGGLSLTVCMAIALCLQFMLLPRL